MKALRKNYTDRELRLIQVSLYISHLILKALNKTYKEKYPNSKGGIGAYNDLYRTKKGVIRRLKFFGLTKAEIQYSLQRDHLVLFHFKTILAPLRIYNQETEGYVKGDENEYENGAVLKLRLEALKTYNLIND